jgi:hypothetical protein
VFSSHRYFIMHIHQIEMPIPMCSLARDNARSAPLRFGCGTTQQLRNSRGRAGSQLSQVPNFFMFEH